MLVLAACKSAFHPELAPSLDQYVRRLRAGTAGLSCIACTEQFWVPRTSPLRLGRGAVTLLTAGVLQESLDRSWTGAVVLSPSSP